MRAISSPTWLVIGLGLFSCAILIWLIFPMLSDGGAAAQMAVPGGLFSRLAPNYSSDNIGEVFYTLRVSIVGEVAGRNLMEQMERPVPTATWRDFAGAAPYTATPTHTPTPTNTATPTSTATPTNTATRRPTNTPTDEPDEPTDEPEEPKPPTNTPTITPTPSDTPIPTNTATATNTATPIPDVDDPQVTLKTLAGSLENTTCTITIGFDVEDPKPSAGIDDSQVRLIYEYPIGGGSKQAGLDGGGNWDPPVPAEKWFGNYSGQISEVSTAEGENRLRFSVEVTDKAGRTGTFGGFTYEVDEACKVIETD